MDTLETVLLILLVLDAVALVALVLLQQSKGSEVGAAFGSGGANTMFGSSAASFLTKLTAGLSAAFFLIAFGLAYMASERAASLGGFDIEDRDTPLLESVDDPDPGSAPVEGDELPDLSGDSPTGEVDQGEGDDLPPTPESDPELEPDAIPEL